MTPALARLIACSRNGLRLARHAASLLALASGLIVLPTIASALPSGSINIDSIAVTQTTGEKPQSKVWKHAGRWWSVLCNSSGTQLRRLDTNHWTNILQLSTATDAKADVKAVGDTVHVLLYRGTSSQLVSVQYVPASTSYQLWSVRSSTVNITLDSGVEAATIDVDSQGRMWLASDGTTAVNVRWADRPYSTWSAPIQLVNNITADDISSVIAIPGGKVGVFWSNQTTARYGFRTHTDGTTPTTWTADEVPASQSAFTCANALGMADDHLHVAAASNGTIYAAVKTGCDAAVGEAVILMLVRRPAGTWDNAYIVDTNGTRPIVLLNESLNQVSVIYTQANGLNPIVYKDSPTSAIAFGSRQTVIAGGWNDVTSTKQNITTDAVILASSPSAAFGVFRGTASATFTITASAGSGGTISPSGSVSVTSGANQAFTITANSGFHVANVLVDGSSVGAVTTFTFSNVTANHTIAASFAANTTPTFTIAASAGTGGTISPSGSVTVNSGANQAFTITPNSGFHVANVLVDGSSVGAVTTFTFSNVTANHTISASFAVNTFTIAASAGTGGTISPTGSVTVNSGANQAFTITPNSGFHVANVLVDGSSVGAVTTFTFNNVTANHTISASFAVNTFTIAASAGTGGTISPTGSVTVNSGANQAFTITPNSGFHVANVLVDGSSVGAVTTFTFNNVTANHTIAASFAANTTPTFTIAASAGAGGTISPSGSVTVNSGANQAFTITPNSGFHVANVLVDGSSVGAVTTFTFNNVTANHTISASFAVNTFTIAASAGTGGTISPTGSVTVNSGANQAFTITPNSGFHVANVLVDGSSVGAVTTFTFSNVTANHTIAASFAANTTPTFTITASAGSGGTISPSGSVTVNSGANQAFTITPNTGFQVANVLVDGSSVGAVTTHTFNNVTANHTISASFAANPTTFTLAVSVVGNGTVAKNPDQASYNAGSTVQLTATPALGSHFVGWSGGASGATNPLTVTMNSNLSITATFELDTGVTTNLVGNPGFETDLTGWGHYDGAVLAQVAGGHSGAFALQLTNATTTAYGCDDKPNWVPLVAGVGRIYRFTAWVRSDASTSPVKIRVYEYAGSTQVGNTFYSNQPALTTGWQLLTADYVVRQAGTTLSMRVTSAPVAPGESFLVDDVGIELLGGLPTTFAITASAGAGGTISPSGSVTVNSGANQAFTITPNTGFHVMNVLVDGSSVGAVTTHTFNNVTANHTISASFAANTTTFSLAVSVVGNGTVAKNPDQASYNAASTVQLTATPAIGSHFVGWSGDATGSVNPLAVTMDANKVITATFVVDGSGTNLVANSTFETGLTGWTDYGAILAQAAGGHTGAFAMQMTAPTTSSYGCDDKPNWVTTVASVGRTYRFTAWVRSDNSTGPVKLRVYEYAGATQVGTTFYSSEPALTTGWQLLTADYVVRQAGTTLSLRVTSVPVAAGAAFLVDDVGIELLPVAAPAMTASLTANEDPSLGAFGARLVPSPLRARASQAGSLHLTTTVAGPLKAQLFDVAGRVVHTLADMAWAPSGPHTFHLNGERAKSLEPGVYYYRIQAVEGVLMGRVVVVP